MKTFYDTMDSPIGTITLTSNGIELTGVYMEVHRHGPVIEAEWIKNSNAPPLPQARNQLTAYFAGKLREFQLPMSLVGTPFQQKVWSELTRIPYGVTMSYGQLANRIGNRNSSRAVGLANGRNPISIIVPCHRVIGSNGQLVGYGGGLDRKTWLLQHEQGPNLLDV